MSLVPVFIPCQAEAFLEHVTPGPLHVLFGLPRNIYSLFLLPTSLLQFQRLTLCLPLISELNVTSLTILPNFDHSLTLHHNFQLLPSFGFHHHTYFSLS